MDRAVRRWTLTLKTKHDETTVNNLVRKLSRTYSIYGSMILLPPRTIDGEEVCQILDNEGIEAEHRLYELIMKEMNVTHIAINQPIPAQQASITAENTIRAPLNFKPVFGDFGPIDCSVPPSEVDFKQAYWVTAKQNGIAQVWAPRWTMFSRGNISEKVRILNLPTVQQAVAEGRDTSEGCTVVDLYAGIGYFTFSYAKAGVSKVLCWELNEWSCEGLRRGSVANRWQSITYDPTTDLIKLAMHPAKIIIFNETNELAIDRISRMRRSLSPIRHVNCGLLPTSRGSWSIAVAALDQGEGGWIHLHENFGSEEIGAGAQVVLQVIQSYVDAQGEPARIAILEHINRVKTYAPGVWHCVLDIHIPGVKP